MARKDIYFLSTGSEGQRGFLSDLIVMLQSSLGAKCNIFRSFNDLVQRLAKRKTRLNILVLIMDKIGEEFIDEIREKVPEEAYPQKVIFVQSSFSSIGEGLLRESSKKLREVKIEPIPVSLMEISSVSSMKQLLEI